MRTPLATALFLMLAAVQASAYTKSGTTYTTDGSMTDVQAAINVANTGAIVTIPPGSFTWGAKNTSVFVNKAITLQGSGTTSTTIVMSSSGPTYGGAAIVINAAATVKSFSISSPAGTGLRTPLSGGASNFRVTDIIYTQATGVSSYFIYVNSAYGLIDNCQFNGGAGTSELIFIRGPSNSWQTPNSMGTANAVYIEKCTFNGSCYVCDANSNARAVVRYCTITNGIKIDAHGKASNTPPRGCRQIEAYGNHWTAIGVGGAWAAMELRGGTGMVFNNTNDDNTYGGRGFLRLTDYGCTATWGNFSNTYQTPTNYPVDDQIGIGMDPKPKTGGAEPMYLWNNLKAGAPLPFSWAAIPAAAIKLYQTQTQNASVPYTFQLAATGEPTSWVASGDPPNILVNPSTGLLSGTATAAAGAYNIAVSAKNSSGTGTGTFSIIVSAQAYTLPNITSAMNAVALIGQPFSYQITAANNPTGFGAVGLPAGLSVDPGTGLISGTTSVSANKISVTLSATNASGTSTAKVLLIVSATTPTYPVITNAASSVAYSGAYYTMQDIIKADRDYFTQGTGFDGSSGVGVGLTARMNTITPTKVGVGFWVTDQGSWDSTKDPNTSGLLYVWNGSVWKLKYTPFPYPYPVHAPTTGGRYVPPQTSTQAPPISLQVLN